MLSPRQQLLPSISQAWTEFSCKSLALGWAPTLVGVSETIHAQLQGRSRWDGHPLLLECLKQLTHSDRGVHSGSHTSLQLVPSVFVGVKVRGQGRPGENFGRFYCWRETVWCGVLHGVWHCRVEVQWHTMFDVRNNTAPPPPPQQKSKKQKKKKSVSLLNSIY